jgi:hypothetical protein
VNDRNSTIHVSAEKRKIVCAKTGLYIQQILSAQLNIPLPFQIAISCYAEKNSTQPEDGGEDYA